jgi:hypothetical protein
MSFSYYLFKIWKFLEMELLTPTILRKKITEWQKKLHKSAYLCDSLVQLNIHVDFHSKEMPHMFPNPRRPLM